jgi:hypothetical protein
MVMTLTTMMTPSLSARDPMGGDAASEIARPNASKSNSTVTMNMGMLSL